MFRIRQVSDDATPANAATLAQVQEILRTQFPGLDSAEVDALPDKLRDPLKLRFRPILLVAENASERLQGFALLLHAPDLGFCYLDFIAAAPNEARGGVGGALYERVRELAVALGSIGVFFECLPDDEALCADPGVRAQNAARLAFYERFGARPIAGTAYETPLEEGGDNPPYLCFDGLGLGRLLDRETARRIVRAILERKYGAVCPPGYIDRVVDSFRDDPIRLRPPRYRRRAAAAPVAARRRLATTVLLVVNDRHDIHHMRDRGYVEAPVRISSILKELEPTGLFEKIQPRRFPERHIRAVHDGRFVDYLRRACAGVGSGRSVYPYVFPIRNPARPPRELPLRAGYYCIDTFTPINGNAWRAARRAVDCALTAAERVLEGQRLAYALVRPPGHHAERRSFGGFCYFNNAAVAAHFLSRYGRVAVLDIDYHHGNGTQDIFYRRRDVLTVSIHGHPSFAYPYFSGFREEGGAGAGAGYNLNLPLPETITPERYREELDAALRRVARFAPEFLVVAAGFDTASGDPTGSWSNRRDDFTRIGDAIGRLGMPTLVVQEGGYRVRTLGANARHFFEGLAAAASVSAGAARRRGAQPAGSPRLELRTEVREEDTEAVRSLVEMAGVFNAEEVDVAVELVRERLDRGAVSGYEFVMAERGGGLAGFACYGPIPGAAGRFDLYWIVVHPEAQQGGIGRLLLRRCEAAVAESGGERLYVDTAGAERYEPARRFYRARGFRKAAELPGFYAEGDAKVIFMKQLSPADTRQGGSITSARQ